MNITYQVRRVVRPALTMSSKAVSMSASLSWAIQYAFVPAAVNSLPLSMNFWPSVVTKPVPTGVDEGAVDDAVCDTVDVAGTEELLTGDELGAAGALLEADAAPGKHSGVVNSDSKFQRKNGFSRSQRNAFNVTATATIEAARKRGTGRCESRSEARGTGLLKANKLTGVVRIPGVVIQ